MLFFLHILLIQCQSRMNSLSHSQFNLLCVSTCALYASEFLQISFIREEESLPSQTIRKHWVPFITAQDVEGHWLQILWKSNCTSKNAAVRRHVVWYLWFTTTSAGSITVQRNAVPVVVCSWRPAYFFDTGRLGRYSSCSLSFPFFSFLRWS